MRYENAQENQNPGIMAPHIPADVYEGIQHGEIAIPNRVIPAGHTAPEHRDAVRVWTNDGREIVVHMRDVMGQIEQARPPAPQPLPRWVRAAAVLMPVASGSTALVLWGIGQSAPGLHAAAELLRWLVLLVVATAVVVGWLVASRPRTKGSSGAASSATAVATSTTTATARGLFPKATATATTTATAVATAAAETPRRGWRR